MTNMSWLQFMPAFLRHRLEGRYALQAVAANTGWLMADKLTRILVSLIVGAWVARYLGPAQFGELAYALALTAFFQAVANLGLDGIVVRDIARDSKRAPEILGTALYLRTLCGSLAWALAIFTVLLLRPGDSRALVLVALISLGTVFQAADTVDLWFQSQTQSRRTVLAKLVSMLVSNGVRIGLILRHAPLEAFAAIQLVEVALGALCLGIAYRRFPACATWGATIGTGKKLLLESWPLLLGGISVAIYMRINQLMLREMTGGRELGVFSAVLPFAEVWNVIPVTICTSVAPIIVRKKAEGEENYYAALQLLFSALAWCAIIISISIALVAPMLVKLLLGDQFRESVPLLMILVFSSIPIFLGVAQGIWIIVEGKSRLAFAKAFSGAVSSVFLNVILIPIYGAKGAAFATVASQMISAVISNAWFAPKIFKMQLQFYRMNFSI